MTSLAGRTALVSGASRGIGLAVARALVSAGARVGLIARGEAELAARAAELGERASVFPCDVGDPAAVARTLADAARRFSGAPDIVVNSAGLFSLARIEETTAEAFARTLDVNLVGPFILIRGVADRHTYPENGAYAASKFGLRAMHEVLRDELRGSGVRATLVSPGPVNTSLWDAVDPDSRPGFTPRGAMLAAEAVADAVIYAATSPSSVNIDELRLSRS